MLCGYQQPTKTWIVAELAFTILTVSSKAQSFRRRLCDGIHIACLWASEDPPNQRLSYSLVSLISALLTGDSVYYDYLGAVTMNTDRILELR